MISLSLAVNSTSWMTTVAAGFFLGLFWQQMAFIGHDIGHHSVTHDTKADDVIACVIGNLLTGISVGWWRDSHNFHHIVTNSVNYDPDVQHLPVFAISKKFFTTFFSEYHKREFKIDAVAKLFVPYQHYLFYPVMAVARVNLYAQSLLFVLTSKHCQKKVPELASLLLFWVWFLAFCSVFPSWSHRLMFFFAAHATAGRLGIGVTLSATNFGQIYVGNNISEKQFWTFFGGIADNFRKFPNPNRRQSIYSFVVSNKNVMIFPTVLHFFNIFLWRMVRMIAEADFVEMI